MTERQQQLLKLVVDLYIRDAEPVSSLALAEDSDLGVSSATIRNELVALENDGYITSPHTSAGRIPTDKGYRFYIESFVDHDAGRSQREQELLRRRAATRNAEQRLRQVAQELSALTGEAVVVTRAPQYAYTTGVSRLFAQPEFNDVELMRQFSGLMDAMDGVFEPYVKQRFDDVRIFVGDQSPFGERTSSLMISFHDDHGQGMISILGPTRMNYAYNRTLLREVQRLLSDQ